MPSQGKFTRMGRPSELTDEVQEKIITAIRAGNYIETAAAYCGVSKVSLYSWMKRGNKETKGIYRNFLNAVQIAMAAAEVRDVAIIGKAAEVNWPAAAWRLERKFPDRWGRKERMQLSGDPDAPIVHEIHVTYDDIAIESDETIAIESDETDGSPS